MQPDFRHGLLGTGHLPYDDTIAALATPPGRGAVSIVRVSGAEALNISMELAGLRPQPRHAHVCTFRDEAGRPVDRGMVLFFPGPGSSTGDDVVELHGHGGMVVSDWLLNQALRLGARPAEPGEFTLRAFLNDKLDLAQAEAVADLVDSGSRAAARAAARSLCGAFSKRVEQLQAALTALRVRLEAWLDFPDEELELDPDGDLEAGFGSVTALLDRLLDEARQGAVLRDGLNVVIAGPPNAGKSSLMNRLAGYDAAIVTQIPGTTRDPLREYLSVDGLPVCITDTAGFRPATDPVEVEGVRRAQRAVEHADRVLWLVDVRDDLGVELARARAEVDVDTALTVIRNKVDLVSEGSGTEQYEGLPVIRLSALTGDGTELLREHLKGITGFGGESPGTFSARSRHLDALLRARVHVRDGFHQLQAHRALELAAEELRAAQGALGELTGDVTSDDLLGEIFASFCIGK